MKLIELLAQEKIELTALQIEQLETYADMLIEWNQKFNLTAILNKEEIYTKHFLDSLLLIKYSLSGSLCDVGTGAGFPGIVLKIALPELKVTLLEPNNKKITFLNHVITTLGLKDITAINQRSEDYAREHFQQFDYVTSRAVAALNILDELCLPLTKVNGHFLVMKGPKVFEELQQAERGIKLLSGKVEKTDQFNISDEQTRFIVDIVKTNNTDKKYPRNYSQIKKKPL